MSVTPQAVPARVCAGVDWATADHVVCVVDPDGEVLDPFTIAHTAAGMKRLIGRLLSAGVSEIGIERPDGPVVDALLQAELTVLVIAPNQVKNLRALRVGWQQGRPVRRLRAGRCHPHRRPSSDPTGAF